MKYILILVIMLGVTSQAERVIEVTDKGLVEILPYDNSDPKDKSHINICVVYETFIPVANSKIQIKGAGWVINTYTRDSGCFSSLVPASKNFTFSIVAPITKKVHKIEGTILSAPAFQLLDIEKAKIVPF